MCCVLGNHKTTTLNVPTVTRDRAHVVIRVTRAECCPVARPKRLAGNAGTVSCLTHASMRVENFFAPTGRQGQGVKVTVRSQAHSSDADIVGLKG